MCATELRVACDAIDGDVSVVVEPAGVTLDRLAALADDAESPVWLTLQPFPAMLDDLRSASGSTPRAARPACSPRRS